MLRSAASQGSWATWLPITCLGTLLAGLGAFAIPCSPQDGFFPTFGWSCAFVSFVASLAAWPAVKHRDQGLSPAESVTHFAKVVALLLGVTAALIQLVILLMTAIPFAVDLINGYPWQTYPRFGFGPQGLWVLGLIFASCTIGLIATGDRRLFICHLWITVMIAAWGCLLAPSFRFTATGFYHRTGNTLWLQVCASALTTLAAMAGRTNRLIQADRRGRIESPAETAAWFALEASCGGLALMNVLLAGYHLAVPMALLEGGYRSGFLATTGSAFLAAFACLQLGLRRPVGYLLDIGLTLVTLGIAAAACAFIWDRRESLAEFYPRVFTALVWGGNLAAAGWTAMTLWCRSKRDTLENPDWYAAVAPHARRSGFLALAFSLLVSALMGVWPRLPSIAATDDSIGRVTTGLAANLALILAARWSARRLGGLSLHLLELLAVLSAMGFLAARVLPFASR